MYYHGFDADTNFLGWAVYDTAARRWASQTIAINGKHKTLLGRVELAVVSAMNLLNHAGAKRLRIILMEEVEIQGVGKFDAHSKLRFLSGALWGALRGQGREMHLIPPTRKSKEADGHAPWKMPISKEAQWDRTKDMSKTNPLYKSAIKHAKRVGATHHEEDAIGMILFKITGRRLGDPFAP